MAVQIALMSEQTDVTLTDDVMATIRSCLERTAELEQIDKGEVAITFVNDEKICRLNETYRKMNQPTDVLSFPMIEGTGEFLDEHDAVLLLGDIVISVSRAASQAEEYGHTFERELAFLAVHGFLHLLGYDHDTKDAENRMFKRQEEVLSSLGIRR